MHALGIKVEAIQFDANKENAATIAYDFIHHNFGKLGILVSNAGVNHEQLMGAYNSSSVSGEVLQKTFQTNLFSVIALTQKLLPLIKKAPAGRIVNLFSVLA